MPRDAAKKTMTIADRVVAAHRYAPDSETESASSSCSSLELTMEEQEWELSTAHFDTVPAASVDEFGSVVTPQQRRQRRTANMGDDDAGERGYTVGSLVPGDDDEGPRSRFARSILPKGGWKDFEMHSEPRSKIAQQLESNVPLAFDREGLGIRADGSPLEGFSMYSGSNPPRRLSRAASSANVANSSDNITTKKIRAN